MDSKQTHCPSFAPEEDVVFIILHSKQNFCSYLQLPRLHYAWKYSVEQKPVGAFAHKTWRNMSNPWRIISLHFVGHQMLFPRSIAESCAPFIDIWHLQNIYMEFFWCSSTCLRIWQETFPEYHFIIQFQKRNRIDKIHFFFQLPIHWKLRPWKGMVTSSKHLHLNI